MDRLEEDSWWMNLLEEKLDEQQREDLCGYRYADSWWFNMGRMNLPKITLEPWSDHWWMTIAFGKEESVEAAEPADNSPVDNNSIMSTQVVSDPTVSAGAAIDSSKSSLTVAVALFLIISVTL